jgi:hypothetical protein
MSAIEQPADRSGKYTLRVTLLCRQLRELQAVAGVVGELDHVVLLVVMSEDDQPLAQGLAILLNPLGDGFWGKLGIERRNWRLKQDHWNLPSSLADFGAPEQRGKAEISYCSWR